MINNIPDPSFFKSSLFKNATNIPPTILDIKEEEQTKKDIFSDIEALCTNSPKKQYLYSKYKNYDFSNIKDSFRFIIHQMAQESKNLEQKQKLEAIIPLVDSFDPETLQVMLFLTLKYNIISQQQ